MSTKLLNVFGDENSDLHKQIGCMTGIFQMFDRQHLLSGRRHAHGHKRLPSGNTPPNSSHFQAETKAASPRVVLEKNLSKSLNESHRVSVESSRASFSSSSCSSSLSSVECNKSTRQEPSLYDRTTFPERSLKNSPMLQGSDIDTRPLQSSPCLDMQDFCAPSKQSPNFRDVVKDSIYRDYNGLSVKTLNKEDVKKHVVKHQDSPRPLPLSKSMDGSYGTGINEKTKMSVDLKESLWVLAKLKEAPSYFSEDKDPRRSSYEGKDGSFFSVRKESPRFSYDGRDCCPSLDSRENSRCSNRLRELPRLSLDSRQGSIRHSNFDSKSNSLMEDLESSEASQRTSRSLTLQQDLEGHKRPTSVVAKLMGLEAMPLGAGVQDQLHFLKRCTTEDSGTLDVNEKTCLKSLKMLEERKQERLPCSPKSSVKDSVTPLLRAAGSVMKPISNSRLPIETAPWGQQGKSHGTQKMTFGSKGHTRQRHESVYSEIERKLKGLEFQQSNKDLRALKHILEAIQAKGLLEAKKVENHPSEASDDNYSNLAATGYDQNLRTTNRQNPKSCHRRNNQMKGTNASRPLESPIVIMKPAKSVNRSGIPASSVVHFNGLSTLRRVRISDTTDTKKALVHNQTAKEQSSKLRLSERSSLILLTADKKPSRSAENSSQKTSEQIVLGSSRPHQSTRENSGYSVKTSSSLSPRLQQRKHDLEKKSRPPIPSSESAKQQKQSVTRHVSESVSPRGKIRRKSEKAQRNNDQLSEISNETRTLSHHDEDISLKTESNVSLTSQFDAEVNSADRLAELDSIFIQQGTRSPLDSTGNHVTSIVQEKKSLQGFNEDASTELSTISLEQPSPVSVLDASFYKDDQPLSPVNKISNLFRGDDSHNSDIPRGANWKRGGPDSHLPNNPNCDLSSTMSHKKLESIENLLQKLRRLSSSNDEAPVTDHIASLCENQNPDHRYVSEILLASGLLLKDLGGGPTEPLPVQLHQSGYPINPDLFLVLEQTKSGIIAKSEQPQESTVGSKLDPEKLRRRLLFDALNEILVQKLELAGPGPQPKTSLRVGKLTDKTPTGKQLLKELCLEIENLQTYGNASTSLEEDDDALKPILCEDVARQSEAWTDFGKEVSGLVLDIERSIFKDLIDEVVIGGSAASGLPAKPSRQRRQLFTR